MVFVGNDLTAAEKVPVPVPLATLLFAVVGLVEVCQTIPLSVTVAPPSEVTFPPKSAEAVVINACAVVVTVGVAATVVKSKVVLFVIPAKEFPLVSSIAVVAICIA